jgi:Holliday junction resolvase
LEAAVKESAISREIVTFMKTVGFAVWDSGQGYRSAPGGTRMTPGLADLIIIGHGGVLFVEVKTEKGKLRDSQIVFKKECWDNSVAWQLWRSVTDAFDWCVDMGIIEEAT